MTGKRRRRWRWWHVYLLLLVLSNIVQLVWPGWPGDAEPANQRAVTVPRMGRAGEVDGKPVELTYRTYGDPDSPIKVLAIHGSPKFGPDYAVLGPLLAERAHVVAFDAPGFGGSTKWVGDYGIEAQAHYALAVMDQLGWRRAHVFGYSLGSGVALEMFDAQPDRIRSLTFYGGVGIMEGEGSGDFQFEHLKYRVGYAVVVVGFELVPHGGLLGKRSLRHAFMRSFMDTDQRPLRRVLEKVNEAKLPMLIVHDHDDVLVPAATARAHHDIVEHSQLVMLAHGHMGLFEPAGAQEIADAVLPFLEQASAPGFAPVRQTDDTYAAKVVEVDSPLPFGLDLKRDMSPWQQIFTITIGCYILEDPTTVFTGLMVVAGQVDLFVALFGIFFGIFTGDFLLYLTGRIFGQKVLRWGPLTRRLPVRHIERLNAWFDRHGWSAVLASRFIPGTRFPLYVSAGALGMKPLRFAMWTGIAVAIWAVVMLAIVLALGEKATSPFKWLFGDNILALIAAVVVLLFVVRAILLLSTKVGRGRLIAKITRLWQPEFWPMWVFYPPVWLYIGWLMLTRGGLSKATAANPAIPAGGFIDESKSHILGLFPDEWVIPYAVIDSPEALRTTMTERGWSYPIILKPDTGYRGRGVMKVDDDAEADEYFAQAHGTTIAQVFHPGPFEAGVFYYRLPGDDEGHIFSITDKRFPVITGDGVHTLEQLIFRHRRYRMQGDLYVGRHGDDRDRVLAEGERFSLGVAGNHCQGTKFLDGAHLITEPLRRRVDAIARHREGVYFGRFDVRYADAEAFKAGRDFAIMEFNGLTAESTNIYDPSFALWRSWRVLCRQWALAFDIGCANARNGAATTSTIQLLKMTYHHMRHRTKRKVAD